MFRVSITSRAERDPKHLDRQVKNRIVSAITALASEPRPYGCLKVRSEEGGWRIHEVRGDRQRNPVEVDTLQAVRTDEGDIRPPDCFADQLHIGFAGDEAKLAALHKRPQPGVEFVADIIVERARGRRHNQFPLAQFVPHALGFVECGEVFHCK